MLTKEQILKVARLMQQTGTHSSIIKIKEEKYTIRIKLEYVELPNGDVVIQKKRKH